MIPEARTGLRRIRVWQWSLLMLGVGLGCLAAVLFVMDRCYPHHAFVGRQSRLAAVVVTAEDGTPLRTFADAGGVWRYPLKLDQVAPLYLEALVAYEDRWYRYHPGVNPLSLMRAAWQNWQAGRIVSGGSTLTMQTVRLLGVSSRTWPGKLRQIMRAMQLEWHLTKAEILTLYINLAPFGGPLEGVGAAAYAYLGKLPRQLTHAEAALLAVLPQAPSRYRPDRRPQRARRARDKVLRRMETRGLWKAAVVQEARQEPVQSYFDPRPMRAPLLARRLKKTFPRQAVIQTYIDADLQLGLEELILARQYFWEPGVSAAVMVMRNRDLAVLGYLGSADFFNGARFGHVDMAAALRSPGSTTKPLLYGLALDAGLVHSKSLLSDVPAGFGDYRPANFNQGFSGPVTVTQALQRSLNLPAIQILDQLGPNTFWAALMQAGMRLRLPASGRPNLSLALGGFGTNLESLVGLFSALSRGGMAGRPRLQQKASIYQRRVLSHGAAWIVHQILADNRRADRPAPGLMAYGPEVAWKTGTSYGFRDSWALGTRPDVTVGVWVGCPDGSSLPGYQGATIALPLLFEVMARLPENRTRLPQPDSVTRAEICWPLGGLAAAYSEALCHQRHEAFVLNATVPPTLSVSDELWQSNPLVLRIDATSGQRVDQDCDPGQTNAYRTVALWPKGVEPWIPPHLRRQAQIPPIHPRCPSPPRMAAQRIAIVGLAPDSHLQAADINADWPSAEVQAQGGVGRRYWFLNGRLLTPHGRQDALTLNFRRAGKQQVAVVDVQGNTDHLEVWVDLGRGE